MNVVINGKGKEFSEDSLTVKSLLEELNLGSDNIAVELNREIVPKLRFSEVLVYDNDVVELVRFVGGG